MNLLQLIESLEIELLEYFMPDEEREQQRALMQKHGLNDKHLKALKFLVLGKHVHSKNRAVSATDMLKACDQKCLDDLISLGMIEGVPSARNRRVMSGYFATLPGFLMGHAYQRGYLK